MDGTRKGVDAYFSFSLRGREVGWGGRLFEAGRLLNFSAFWMGTYSRLGAYSNKYGNDLNSKSALIFCQILSPGSLTL